MTERARIEIVADQCTNDGKEVLRLAAEFKERLGQADVPPVSQRAVNEVGVFDEIPVDLAALAAAGSAGLPFAHTGKKLIFRKMGSNPGARLVFRSAGRLTQFYPGCRMEAPFEGGTLILDDGSSVVGTALFTIVKLEGYDFIEPPNSTNVPQSTNIFLLGSNSAAKVITYIPVTEDTDPSGVAPTGSFTVNGFTGLVILIDGNTAGGNATSFDLVPWYDPNRDGDWHEQGTERISVPDSDTSGQRYRVIAIRIQNAIGDMYFAIRNLLAAGRTGLGEAVIGVN